MIKKIQLLMTTAIAVTLPATAGEITGKVTVAGARHAGDAIVYVDTIPGKSFDPPEEHATIDQKGMVFDPHVLPVLAGTTVDFLNSDPFLHNVFSPDECADKFNLGSWPQGETRSFTFDEPCVAVLLCNVHPEMEAFVVAVSTPYFAVTDRGGAYTIQDVPDGTYTVKVWHPKVKDLVEKEMAVSGPTVADFEVKQR